MSQEKKIEVLQSFVEMHNSNMEHQKQARQDKMTGTVG
jgi:hypothetical protein